MGDGPDARDFPDVWAKTWPDTRLATTRLTENSPAVKMPAAEILVFDANRERWLVIIFTGFLISISI